MKAVASAAAALARLNDGLLLICKYLIIAIVAGLAAILISAVFYRYALNNAIAWSSDQAASRRAAATDRAPCRGWP